MHGYINSVKQNRDLREVKMIKCYCHIISHRLGSIIYQFCVSAVSFFIIICQCFLSVSQQILLRSGVPKGKTRNRSLGQLMRMYSAIVTIGMTEFFLLQEL